MPSARQLPNLALVFGRSAAQQADLDTLLAAQQNTSSPLYHRWLTPQTFAARFGMADADMDTAKAWLTQQGFSVTAVPPGRDRIVFSGTVAQVQAAFATELHLYELNGERHFGPASDLSLPAALAPVTATVLHLSDLRPKPNSHPVPAYTDGTTGRHFLGPADLAILYDLHASTSDGLTGNGQSIAIVGESYTDPNLLGLGTFNQALGYGLSATLVLVPGSGVEATEPGALAETQLDIEYASGTAPLASLFYVFVGDDPTASAFDALFYSIQQNIAPIVSISYGICETLVSSADGASANALFQQAAAQGQTLVAASGDSGSTGCARFTSSALTDVQRGALAVGFPASSQYVTAIGGTQMTPDALTTGANSYWAGSSTLQDASVLSYVPEIAWNEGSPALGILAGGGGASTLFPRPDWQNALPGIPPGSTRLVPDVAMQASVMSPGFLLCTNDIAYVGYKAISSCANNTLNSLGYYAVAGGTSFPTPVFAGSVALLNQFTQEQRQGSLNATLYAIAANPATNTTAFHDITAGSIACVTGASGCTSAGQAGFSAGAGFDEATGLGSVDFAHLRAAWPANPNKDPSLQSLVFSCGASPNQGTRTFAPGSPAEIDCVLQPQDFTGTPGTGSVTAFLDGAPLGNGSAIPLPPGSSSNVNFSFTAPTLAGSHLLTVVYPGDASHLPLTGVYPFMVGPVQASGAFALSTSSLTLGANAASTAPVTVTPAAGNAYHGVLYWNLSATQTSGSSSPQLCYVINPVRVGAVTTATLALGAGTACNAPLPSTSGAVRLLVGKPAASLHASRSRHALPIYATLLGLGLLSFRRRTRRHLLALSPLACLALLLTLSALSGCGGSGGGSGNGGGGGSTPPPPPPAPAVYTMTLSASDSVNTQISGSTTFTLTVN